MNDTITCAIDSPSWSASDTSIAEVAHAIDALRRQEQSAATRTSVATLVVVSHGSDSQRSHDVIDQLSSIHPTRVIEIVIADGCHDDTDNDANASARTSRIDASVSLEVARISGMPIWSDRISLILSGPVVSHLDSVVRPLQLSDLPVVIWFTNSLPEPTHCLIRLATEVVIDTRALLSTCIDIAEAHQMFEAIHALIQTACVSDLSWNRLIPTRSILANQFHSTNTLELLRQNKTALVKGVSSARLLIGAWLIVRLGMTFEDISMQAAEHTGIELHCGNADGQQSFVSIERDQADSCIIATCSIFGSDQKRNVLALPVDRSARSLMGSIKRLERDSTFESVVATIANASVAILQKQNNN